MQNDARIRIQNHSADLRFGMAALFIALGHFLVFGTLDW